MGVRDKCGRYACQRLGRSYSERPDRVKEFASVIQQAEGKVKQRKFFFHDLQLELNVQIDCRLFNLLVGMLGRATLTNPIKSRMIQVIQNYLVDRGEFDDANLAHLEAYRIIENLGSALLEKGSFDGDINIIPGHYHPDGTTHTFENQRQRNVTGQKSGACQKGK